MAQERSKSLCLNPSSAWDWVAIVNEQASSISEMALAALARRAARLEPNSTKLCAALGLKAIDSKKFELAKTFMIRAISLDPARPGCNLDYGFIAEKAGDLELALRLYKRESTLAPRDPLPYFNAGNVAMGLGDPRASATNYNWSIEMGADSTGVLKSAAIANLMSGNFTRGWSLYETRFLKGSGTSRDNFLGLQSRKPPLRGALDIYKTSTVLVWPEQGVGDEIMFGSMLTELSEVVGQLLVQLDRRLIPLFRRLLPDVRFFERGAAVPEDLYDFHIAIGSLGQYFRPSIESFKKQKRLYLKADPYRTKELRRVIGLAPNEIAVGLSWHSTNADTGPQRSVPLSVLVQNLANKHTKLVSLQYGDVARDLELIKKDLGIDVIAPPTIDPTNDLDGIAALIEACDEVVSIGNATAHLAGALGKRTAVLVPRIGTRTTDGGVMPGWRWLGDFGTCLWYESVNLFRQYQNEHDWSGVLLRLAKHRTQLKKPDH